MPPLVKANVFNFSSVMRRGREVVLAERDALDLLACAIDESFAAACEMIVNARRQLIVTGMGKSGHIARKVAATFAATGTPATFLHPAEAAHGDLGNLVAGDVLLVFSNSGNTAELRAVLDYARRIDVPIVGVASQSNSLLMTRADVGIMLPRVPEACAVNVAPTTSTTLQLAVGDALAMAVMDIRGITRASLGALHPGGAIGLELTPVGDLLGDPDSMPLVSEDCAMPEVLTVITQGCVGIAGVVNQSGQLVGAISDGDLRRNFVRLHQCRAIEVATPNPRVVPRSMTAGEVLRFLNENEITAAFVVDDLHAIPARPLGIVHIHDLLRLGLG